MTQHRTLLKAIDPVTIQGYRPELRYILYSFNAILIIISILCASAPLSSQHLLYRSNISITLQIRDIQWKSCNIQSLVGYISLIQKFHQPPLYRRVF